MYKLCKKKFKNFYVWVHARPKNRVKKKKNLSFASVYVVERKVKYYQVVENILELNIVVLEKKSPKILSVKPGLGKKWSKNGPEMTQKLQFSGFHPLFPENIIMKNVPKRKYNQGVCLN